MIMAKDLWLPRGYELPDGLKVLSLLYSGTEWQIYNTNGSENILFAHPELARRWNECGLLDDSLFGEVIFGTESFQSMRSHEKYTLAPVENGKSPENKADALAFALALKESRKQVDEVSFHDAVYVEQYSRLLPTWTLTPRVDDEVVLGTWLTGGVVVSAESFRRLTNLAGWMPTGNLVEIVRAAGFVVPKDAELLAKRKPVSKSTTETKANVDKGVPEPEQQQPHEEAAEEKVFRLPGRRQLEGFFNEHVIDIIFNTEKYQAMGLDFPSAIVLFGPPGCGKTFAVERLVEFIDWPSHSIDSHSVGSPYIHQTSKKISEVFDKAIDDAPSVIVIDEMESFLSDRRSGISSGSPHVEEVAEFLRRIPEAINNRVLIIAMTNMIDMIDPAILRRGRFDHIIEVGMPSREEVASLIDSLLCKLPIADDLNINQVVDVLAGKALSDATYVVREAARFAAKNGKLQLDQESMNASLNCLPESREKSRSIGFVWDE